MPALANTVIVDDDKITLEWLRFKLESVSEVTGIREFADGSDCLKYAKKARIELAILDLGIRGGMHGLDAGPKLRELQPGCAILVLSQYSNYWTQTSEWATGYLLKAEAPTRLLFAIEQLFAGKPYVSDEVKSAANPIAVELVESLNPRESEVFQLVLQSKTSREIASQLLMKKNTVSKHLRNIYERLNLKDADRNMDGLREFARSAGLLRPD